MKHKKKIQRLEDRRASFFKMMKEVIGKIKGAEKGFRCPGSLKK